ncbi:MAG TPA: tRNA (N6-threonylcarbamoyladenosine(37)-N6)-methyltransferase TrmO [Opitutaceae bacterium]|nr:tRNA (N6-threonylcarbamoyladenosine(37)-N6)-methyltransferase TrmO [Opitutaceae bacterium]
MSIGITNTTMTTTATLPTDDLLRATCRREHPHCFACSDPAEGGLGLAFRVLPDGAVQATWTGPLGAESYPGIVHGGLTATLLDAAMVHALFARGIAGLTGDLRIRYRSPVCIGSPVTVRAWLMCDFDPGFALAAEIRQGASLCVEANGKFMRAVRPHEAIAVDPGMAAPLATVLFQPIGVIRSEHTRPEQTPIQPRFAAGCRGRVELHRRFAAALDGLSGFSHVYLIYHFNRAGAPRMRVIPFLQDVEHGVFATRAPCRPNAIGLSLVRLVAVEGPVLHIDGIDVLDGTPLLDVKPYVPRDDSVENARGGWTDVVDEATAQERGRRGYPASAPHSAPSRSTSKPSPAPDRLPGVRLNQSTPQSIRPPRGRAKA